MSDAETITIDELPPQDPAEAGQGLMEFARAMTRRQVAMLDRLAEIGMTIAEVVEQEAKARGAALAQAAAQSGMPDAVPPAESLAESGAQARAQAATWGMVFNRTARGVRMTLALQAKLLKQLAAMEQDQARWLREQDKWRRKQDKAEMRAHAVASLDRIERVQSIIRRTLKAQRPDDWDHEVLLDRVRERLWDQDITESVLERPMGELVERICQDLDLTPDWEGWAEEAWGMAEILSCNPDSPFFRAFAETEPPPEAEAEAEAAGAAPPGASP